MAKASKRRLLLVRSGPTEWDLSARLQGQTDLPLAESAGGAVHAQMLAVTMSGVSSVMFSPDEASRQVAAWLTEGDGEGREAKVQQVEALRELNLGLWTGLRVEELETRFERAGAQWMEDPAAVAAPEGETIADLESRLLPVLEKALTRRRTSTAIAVVVRPIAYAMLRCRLERLATSDMTRFVGPWESLGPMWFELDKDDPRLAVAPPEPVAPSKAPAA